ncbi:hypothetical protein ACJX0J_020204, partial [Zea mays]
CLSFTCFSADLLSFTYCIGWITCPEMKHVIMENISWVEMLGGKLRTYLHLHFEILHIYIWCTRHVGFGSPGLHLTEYCFFTTIVGVFDKSNLSARKYAVLLHY